jgi:SAM-dependent methyltransferase
MATINKSKCLNCGLIQVNIWSIGSEYTTVQCTVCKLVWLNPIPSEQTLKKYYQGYYQNRVNNTNLSNNRKLMYKMEYEWLSRYVDSGKILDVGCSDGSFLDHFETGWEKHGVEYENSSKLEETATQKNIKLKIGSLGSCNFESNYFDCISMRGVIEHLRDPREELDIIQSICKPEGYFFITATPDVDSYCADLYREYWNQYKPPEHIYYFSIGTLTLLLEKYGFKRIGYTHFYLNTPYADIQRDYKLLFDNVCHINSNMKKKINADHPFWGNLLTVIFKKT